MPGAAHRLRVLSVMVALLAVLGACSADPPTPSGQPSAVSSPSATATSSPELPKDGRPLAADSQGETRRLHQTAARNRTDAL